MPISNEASPQTDEACWLVDGLCLVGLRRSLVAKWRISVDFGES
jgi:hypothetical protein